MNTSDWNNAAFELDENDFTKKKQSKKRQRKWQETHSDKKSYRDRQKNKEFNEYRF